MKRVPCVWLINRLIFYFDYSILWYRESWTIQLKYAIEAMQEMNYDNALSNAISWPHQLIVRIALSLLEIIHMPGLRHPVHLSDPVFFLETLVHILLHWELSCTDYFAMNISHSHKMCTTICYILCKNNGLSQPNMIDYKIYFHGHFRACQTLYAQSLFSQLHLTQNKFHVSNVL